MGTWIEITYVYTGRFVRPSRALMGTWIEIPRNENRLCGRFGRALMGTWIEIRTVVSGRKTRPGSCPHGHVD